MVFSFLNSLSFFARIESNYSPYLRKRPFVIAIPSSRTSPVLSASEEAEREGIIRGMPLEEARLIIPSLHVLPPNFSLYRMVSEEIFKILYSFSPHVEMAGLGHSYINLEGTSLLWGSSSDAVRKIQKKVMERTGILTSAGISRFRFISAVISRLAPPGEIVEVEEGKEKDFIKGAPLHFVPQLNYRDIKFLKSLNIRNIGDLYFLNESQLFSLLGKKGLLIFKLIHLFLNPPVSPSRKKITVRFFLPVETNRVNYLSGIIRKMSFLLSCILEEKNIFSSSFSLRLLYSDGREEEREKEIYPPVRDEGTIREILLTIFLHMRVRLRLKALEASADKLTPFSQTSLFEERMRKLEGTVKFLRKKYGEDKVKYGDEFYSP